jgi:transcriptional antiterminator NusG
MWYAVWVKTGYEEKVDNMCRKLLPKEYYEDCFIPKVETKKKYQGSWHSQQMVMFPGYIFIITEEIEKVFFALKSVPEFAKILGDREEPIALYEKEVQFLQSMKNKDHIIEMSLGYIENDRIVITNGPLKDYTGRIKKIDRHKCIAIIETEMFGRSMDVKVGLEIVTKL